MRHLIPALAEDAFQNGLWHVSILELGVAGQGRAVAFLIEGRTNHPARQPRRAFRHAGRNPAPLSPVRDMDIADIRSLFAYDEWANARLLRTVAELSDEELTRDLGSSFASIRDTFSHLVVTEWVWLRRWKGESPSSLPEWVDAPGPPLLAAKLREIEAERAEWVASLRDDDLRRQISYVNMKGERWRYVLSDALVHLVNHSTYHRGQIVTMLRQVGVAPPSTDLLLLRDEGG